ncbi:MAG: TIGR03936 family radical SAM-associated protein [Propionibacteriaceae bacterium]|nr:TIGR03936 family radical SAM-associated protein [Propionibacteriaceae bacterium]
MTNTPRQQPEQQAPPAQKLQVRYAKRGRARFTSHRDFHRALERALRRAGVPMAYSSGFNPHQRISFSNASPTGAATEAEYFEISLREAVEPDAVRAALDAALPTGLDILEVVPSPPGGIADRLTASTWEITVGGLGREVLERAVATLLAAEVAEVERMTKTGLRTFDARAAIIDLAVTGDDTLRLVSRHGTPLVRPDDVLQALGRAEEAFAPAEPPLLTRTAQGVWDGTRIVGPFEARPDA